MSVTNHSCHELDSGHASFWAAQSKKYPISRRSHCSEEAPLNSRRGSLVLLAWLGAGVHAYSCQFIRPPPAVRLTCRIGALVFGTWTELDAKPKLDGSVPRPELVIDTGSSLVPNRRHLDPPGIPKHLRRYDGIPNK